MNGLAGTGKSTIAQTIAERAFADGRLGASFFCSRDFEDRSNLQLIFPTLAVQLARRYTEFRSIFVPLVQSDPGIAHESLYGQMKKLLVQPLVKLAISTVIVIDALDECKDEEPASAILSVLGQFVTEVPMVKFFVTGRPEPRIREGFRLPLLAKATDVFVLHEVEPSQVNKDIRLFFRHSFSELKRRKLGLENWPTEEQLYQICERTAGLFVHAMATVRFLDKKNNNPKRQLDRLLQSPESSVFEGKTKFKGMTTLDSLYTSILQGAFGDDDPEDDHRIQSVLGAIILATNPHSPSTIAALLGFEVEDVFPLLLSVHSLLVLQEDTDRPVQPFHKSFPDFIVDPARCSNPRFRISPADQHSKLLFGCLELMNLRLEQNMCKLPDLVTNAEVDDLEDRAERHIDRALQYACRSWYKHLVNTVPGHITPVLHRFLEKKFLFWLEVLSVLGAAREAVDALQVAAKWLNVRRTSRLLFSDIHLDWIQVSPTLDLVRDYFRFLIAFFEVISTSAPHIYHSALPLSPRTSIVRELYKQYARPLTRVTRGLPTSWEPIVATMYRSDFRGEAAWSPCNRFIAVATTKNVEILDAVTLERLKTFECPTGPGAWRLCFSPDNRFLTQFNDEGLASWDLQTGGPIGTIPPRQDMFLSDFFSPTHSVDGTMVAVAYGDPHDNTFISTYDLPSRTHIRSHRIPEGRIVTPIWTYGEYLRFVAVKRTSITVSEVPFTLAHAPVEVESLPAPNEIAGGYNFIFLPALSRLAFTFQGTILVWDAKVSKLLLKSGPLQALDFSHNPPRFPFMGSFSPDGRFFACMSATHEVYMWKETPAGYALHQKLPFVATGTPKGPLLSPNGESVIFSTRPTINLWPTEDLILSNPNVPTRDNIGQGFNLEFSPDETAAAFVRHGSDTVMTLDLQSGDPLLVIDAGMGIDCLAVTGDAVVVVGEGKVVTWNLPRGNCGLSPRANTNDRVQVTTYGRSQHGHSPLFRDLREPNFVSISPDLRRIVIAGNSTTTWPPSPGLEIYDVSTGWHLMEAITSTNFLKLRFAPDGREVWGVYGDSSVEGWKIIEHSRHGATLKHLEPSARPQGVFPWESPRGYGVMHDGWILSPTQKRLLWLPHYWRSDEKSRTWGGRFLGLHHRELAEVVILEFID